MTNDPLLAAAVPGSAARLWQAFELPAGVPAPALLGVLVGALSGIAVFVTVVLVVTRRRRAHRASDVVVIPPYVAHPARALPPVMPSTALSARAFAKMGFAFGERVDGPAIDPFETLTPDETGDASPVSVNHTQPFMLERPRPASAEESAPNPLAVIPASSSAMIRAAEELPELDYEDNGDTVIGEPFFDEPPKPRTMGERPKIRPIAPSPPRFARPLPSPPVPPDPPTLRRLTDVP